MDIIENNHITPTTIVGICGTLLNNEINTHTLDRKKAGGRKVRNRSPTEAFIVITGVMNIPITAKLITSANNRKNLRTIQRKREFPCAEITSNI